MHRLNKVASPAALVAVIMMAICLLSCRPEQTPTRIIVKFMQQIGQQDFDSAQQYVVPESANEIENWHSLVIFPDVSSPPTEKEIKDIDTFIGSLYRFFDEEVTESEALVRVTFFASDALIAYPSVADDPMTPVSASFEVRLVRQPEPGSDEENPVLGPWLIADWYAVSR